MRREAGLSSALHLALRGVLALAATVAVLAALRADPGAAARAAHALREMGPAAAAWLALAYVAGMAVFLPSPILNVVAGFALGPAAGLAVAWPSSVVGACAAFLLGRYLARGPAARLAARVPALAGLDDALATRGARWVALARLAIVVPFAVLNFVCGATRLSLRAFAAGTAVGGLPSLAVQVWAGSLVADAADLRDAAASGGLAVLAVAAALLAAAWFARRSLGLRARAGQEPPP